MNVFQFWKCVFIFSRLKNSGFSGTGFPVDGVRFFPGSSRDRSSPQFSFPPPPTCTDSRDNTLLFTRKWRKESVFPVNWSFPCNGFRGGLGLRVFNWFRIASQRRRYLRPLFRLTAFEPEIFRGGFLRLLHAGWESSKETQSATFNIECSITRGCILVIGNETVG